MARIATHKVCEDHYRLDVRELTCSGLLSGSGTIIWPDGHHVAISGCDGSVKLTYAIGVEKTIERISISKTAVHLGGHRSWFLCPGCNRRIAALYFVMQFRCRHCHDLRYRSQRETPRFRTISRIQRARRRFGGTGNLTKPLPTRPRYMHTSTYQRLVREEAEAWQAYAGIR